MLTYNDLQVGDKVKLTANPLEKIRTVKNIYPSADYPQCVDIEFTDGYAAMVNKSYSLRIARK